MAEQLICNQQVVGSSPIASSSLANLARGHWSSRVAVYFSKHTADNGEVPEWPKGADCKSAGDAFEGSNPSLSTIFRGNSLIRGNSSVGRARAFQARGRGFESRFPLQFAYGWVQNSNGSIMQSSHCDEPSTDMPR